MEVFSTTSLQVAIMAVLITIGFVLSKCKKITDKGADEFTFILLNIVTPCIIVNSFITLDSGSLAVSDIAMCLGLAALTMGVGVAIVPFVYKKEPLDKQKVLRFSIIFSNAGYMAIPLAEAVIGARGVVYASLFVAVFNLILWTIGYAIMSGQKKITIKTVLLNKGVISITIGLLIYAFNLTIPEVLSKPVSYMASLNTPIAMLVLGHFLAGISLKEAFLDKRSYQIALIRLIFLPAAAIGIMAIFRPEYDLFMCVLIQNAAPTATATALFASQMNADAKLASKVVGISTILSLITIPIFILIGDVVTGFIL